MVFMIVIKVDYGNLERGFWFEKTNSKWTDCHDFTIRGVHHKRGRGRKDKRIQHIDGRMSAFKDDFTREFMDSTEEVQEGYYRFKSKTEGYTMLFPVNARVDAVSYGISHDVYEAYIFGQQVEEENLLYDYQITYENKPATNNIEVNLDLLSTHVDIEGKYEKFEHEGKTFYYAKDVFATEVSRPL